MKEYKILTAVNRAAGEIKIEKVYEDEKYGIIKTFGPYFSVYGEFETLEEAIDFCKAEFQDFEIHSSLIEKVEEEIEFNISSEDYPEDEDF